MSAAALHPQSARLTPTDRPAAVTSPTPLPISAGELRARIGTIPRIPLALTPTPLEDMPRLTYHLGGPRVMVKRDDLTGLAFGGNKVRNLEFRMAEALEAGADTVIASLDVLSNSARQTAAAANRLGLRTVLVLGGEQPRDITGNLLVDYVLGARVVFGGDPEGCRTAIAQEKERVESEGGRPWVLTDSPMFALASALAYAGATLELLEQLDDMGIGPEGLWIYLASTGKGQAGPELAVRALGLPISVVGCAVRHVAGGAAPLVAVTTNAAAARLGLDLVVEPDEIESRDEYVGTGYGVPSEAGLEAIELAARTDGLLLDPVYTSKAFAALIDDARTGRTGPEDTAVFIHTGGLPLLFSLAAKLGELANPG